MNERLKKQLRVVFAFWLAGVLALAFLTLRGTDGNGVSPLALLLRTPEPAVPQLLAAPVAEPAAKPAPVAEPAPIPVPEPAPVPADPEMPHGKKAGTGTLRTPTVEHLADGSVAVTVALEGTAGHYTAFSLSQFSRSVDLHGRWKAARTRIHPRSGPVRLVQIETHNGFVRVSATRSESAKQLEERVTLPSGGIRIVFSERK